jgi:hypothetical protein
VGRHAQVGFGIDSIEDLADDMEGGGDVRPAVADEQPHRLADLGVRRLVADRRSDRAVEDDVLGFFVKRLGHAERLQALVAIRALGVEIALHQIVLAIDFRQPFPRFDEDQSVHAVADMHGDRRRRAVVDEEAWVQRLEREH